jgi:RND superfamily putative drug exporter
MGSDANDSDAATEKLNARGQSDNGDRRRRGGGGLSAQDLLRREGRL